MAGIMETKAVQKYQAASNDNRTENPGKLSEYGKTVGKPELSDTAKKYYDQLKKKFGDYDFILVSKEEKENAKANAAKYANGFKTVVLIGEEEVEKMATDENFRKKYEGILSGAQTQLQQLKDSMEKAGSNVKGFGMQVNSDGTVSYFAALKQSSEAQKARIEKHTEEKRAQRRAEAKAERKENSKIDRNTDSKNRLDKTEDSDIISANSLEELLQKISDYNMNKLSDSVKTDEEKLVGQNIDFRG